MTIRRASFLAALAMSILVGVCSAQAQGLDPASSEALAATVRALKSRPGTGPGSGAENLDPRVRALGESPELTRETNELAAQIFTELAEQAGGDVDKMSAMLARGKSDPAAFASSLSPATRERLHALAAKVSPDQK